MTVWGYQLLSLQQAAKKQAEEGGETQAADDGKNRRNEDKQRGQEPNDQRKCNGQQGEDHLSDELQGCQSISY